MQSNTQLWTTLENLRYNHTAHSGWIVIRSQYKNCPFSQTTPLWAEWMLTKTCTSICLCFYTEHYWELSKWFGGLRLTQTLNRTSECLTGPLAKHEGALQQRDLSGGAQGWLQSAVRKYNVRLERFFSRGCVPVCPLTALWARVIEGQLHLFIDRITMLVYHNLRA